MIGSSEVMVYKDEEGFFSFREVIRDEDGDLCGISPHDISPIGKTLNELAEDLTLFIKAIQEDYLDFEELEFDESDEEEEKIFTMKGRGNVH